VARAAITAALALLSLAAPPALGQTVIPRPLSSEAIIGRAPVAIADGATIAVRAGDPGARRAAGFLSNAVQRSRGLRLRVGAGGRTPTIVLERAGVADAGAEGYRIDIGDGRVVIAAPTNAGLFYGAVTLTQLLTPDAGRGPATLAAFRIVDRPRFAWRGLLLDSARHYQSPAFIERLIDGMARLKLNVLQWHLTDDQAWRLEIRRYPRLTAIGAWRTEPDPATGKPMRYGGFYSQAEVRRIVAYAATRHVTIVPEIEMPGHSLSAITAYPELGSAPPQRGVRDDWGVFPDVLAPDERTYAFMTGVLDEVMALFPGPWIAIGGDEAVKDEWRASPAIQAEMRRLGLKDENALQGWFTDRIAAFIAAHGRRAIGWDDILVGGSGLPANAAVTVWRAGGAADAAKSGHDAVTATDPLLYFDHRQADMPDEPPGRSVVVSLSDVYGIDPEPPATVSAAAAHVIGVQGNLWTEHMPTEADVALMAFPRAAALAEVAWTAPERKDWADMEARVPAELTRERTLGLGPDQGAVAVKAEVRRTDAGVEVALSKQLGLGTIRYTLDGAPPGPTSAAYVGPLELGAATRLRAATFVEGREFLPALDRAIDPTGPLRLQSQELQLCSNQVALNIEAPLAVQRGQRYLVDIMNPCWIYPQADDRAGATIRVAVTRLPFNFQLGADTAKVARRPPRTRNGELDVRAGGCDGAPVLSLPLAAATRNPGVTVLAGALPPLGRRSDLCLTFTQARPDPMWVLGWVEVGRKAAAQ
jgi:hexosaminidase